MSEQKDTKRFRERLRQMVKGAVRRGVNLTVEQKLRVILDELFEYEGDYDGEVAQFFDSFLESSNKNAHDIMIPRSRMMCITPQMSVDDIIKSVKDTGHSRYPIQGDTSDSVIGLMHVKDLLTKFSNGNAENFSITDIKRDVQLVPQDMSIISLLKELQRTHIHMAVVVDEFGGVVGLVTMEDVFEQFFGEIQDEHDKGEEAGLLIETDGTQPDPKKNGETTVKADLSIDEFNEHFGSSLSNNQNNTIGGYVLTKLGHVPVKGEKTRADDLLIEIVEASPRRIEKISVTRNGQ